MPSGKTRRASAPACPRWSLSTPLDDAEAVLQQVDTCEYGEMVDLCEGVRVRFNDAGHLLGSAEIELWCTENGVTKKLVFSGDLGNVDQPIIRDPSYLQEADYVIMESTYGDRDHEPPESYTGALAQLIDEVFAKGGNIIIPSFAVGRTQELLYFLREIKDKHMVKSVPNFTVCVDSPLAAEATRIYAGNLHGYLDEEAIAVLQSGSDLFTFPGLTLTQSTEESKALNADKTPKIILSASGMCDAGRIRHHLKHNLWRPECAVVFVGYQARGHAWAAACWTGGQDGQALRRGDRRAGPHRQLQGPVLPRRPEPSAVLGEELLPQAPAGFCGPRGQPRHRAVRQDPERRAGHPRPRPPV